MADVIVIDRRLYLTADRARVVEEGDPDGRWLWAAPGTSVPREQAERFGVAPRAGKARGRPGDKRRHPSADK